MATFTADQAQTAIQPKTIRVGLTAITSFWSIPASISASTTVQMVKVPQGATPVLIQIGNSNAGDSALIVGDGNNTSRFRAAGTLSAGQGLVICALPIVPYTYSVEDTIDILISTASATTLGGQLTMVVIFSMDVRVPTSM